MTSCACFLKAWIPWHSTTAASSCVTLSSCNVSTLPDVLTAYLDWLKITFPAIATVDSGHESVARWDIGNIFHVMIPLFGGLVQENSTLLPSSAAMFSGRYWPHVSPVQIQENTHMLSHCCRIHHKTHLDSLVQDNSLELKNHEFGIP